MAPRRVPPRFPGSRLAHLRALQRDPLNLGLELARHGPIVTFPLLGLTFYVLNDPALIDEVLVKRHHDFAKDTFTRRLSDFLGEGLLTGEGEPWKRQRRLIQPAFHRRRIAGYAAVMSRLAAEHVERWGDGEVLDVHHAMMELTLAIVGETLFGADVEAATPAVSEAIELVMARYAGDPITVLLPLWVPLPGNRRLRAAVARLDEVLLGMIRARREEGRADDDLLALLLAAEDEDGTRMDERQIRDECATLFLAGHETTALTLSYALFLLAQRPDVQDRLAVEVDALGERPAGLDDLPRLVACEQVIKESLRLYPPAWSIGRGALREVEVGGYTLPKGAQVALFQWALHRDPERFPDPEAFRPERWTPEFERALPRHAFVPFGGGPRICIGNVFAMTEAVLVLAAIVRRFRVALAQPPHLDLTPSITLRPTHGVRLAVARRPRSEAGEGAS
ncbi:MAG: cytochrome P450 [Myxococcales bacterium]|nr:cytochrome P450 [Myxococcales bacterium]MCB9702905.1 cytochrome P450 [Myxococcales bacterium]